MNKVPLAEPHEQSQDEFARDPRTWFHGRYAEHLPGDDPDDDIAFYDSYDDEDEDPTFHLGTRKAAQDRLNKLGPGYNDQPGRMFPMRVATRMSNRPETAGQDLGEDWKKRTLSTGQFYKNEFEDPGSVSVVLPGRGQAKSHQELVQRALQEGKYVRPRVAAEFQAMGGRATPGTVPYGEPGGTWEPEGLQYSRAVEYEHPKITAQQERSKQKVTGRLFGGGNLELQLVKDPSTLAGAQWKNVSTPWVYPK